MFDKYMYALGRGVRGAKQAYDHASQTPDPAAGARDITPSSEASDQPGVASPPVNPANMPNRAAPLAFGPRPLVMGIVNATPDSFSDGGDHLDPAKAIAHGLRLAEHGADILDIGGESTRPAHTPVDAETEIARILPVVRGLAASCAAPISIDTSKARVAVAALDAGATVVNDVWGLRGDPDMARVVGERGVHVVVMHNREREDPDIDIIADVLDVLRQSIDLALAAGVARGKIIVDPGVGFGKTNAQSLTILRELSRLKELGCPILLGVSRKRLVGHATGRPARERMAGSIAAAVVGAANGADIIRVHDVAEHVDAMKIFAAIAGRGALETP